MFQINCTFLVCALPRSQSPECSEVQTVEVQWRSMEQDICHLYFYARWLFPNSSVGTATVEIQFFSSDTERLRDWERWTERDSMCCLPSFCVQDKVRNGKMCGLRATTAGVTANPRRLQGSKQQTLTGQRTLHISDHHCLNNLAPINEEARVCFSSQFVRAEIFIF